VITPRALRRGTTLVELMVVLAILSVIASTALLAFRTGQAHEDRTHRLASLSQQVAEARRTALRSGRPMTVPIQDSASAYSVTALPDGSVIADSGLSTVLHLDRLLGQARPDSSGGKSDVAR
jgi:prepilin-type N-terminal cleavage/methylation domain-containing protein